MGSTAVTHPVISEIAIDLLICRERKGCTRGGLMFTDAGGNLIFRFNDRSSKSSIDASSPTSTAFHLVDAGDKPRISVSRIDGDWQGCISDNKDPSFKVKRTLKSFWRKEVEVFLVDEKSGEFNSVFKIRGSPFKRSCTIYQDNSIIAQTNLLYKLGKVIVGRRKFRLTIFPGTIDHAFIVALIVIFLHGSI